MAKKKVNKQAQEILKLAEEKGVKNNFFFTTTFDRYLVLLDMLDEFKKSMEEDGLTVKKEYVKGRKNLYSSPAVKNFNSTTDLANRTVATLIKVIKSFSESESEDTQDPLLSMINGDGDEK